MVTLRHAIKIAAPGPVVYRALTNIDAMRGWHSGGVEGEIAQGEVMRLKHRPGLTFGWRTDTLEPNTRIVQTSVETPNGEVGKTLTFTLSMLADGRTLVELADGEWDPADPNLPFCNTHWGEVLHNLRSFVEQA